MDEDYNDLGEYLKRMEKRRASFFPQRTFKYKKSFQQKVRDGMRTAARWAVVAKGIAALLGVVEYKTHTVETIAGYVLMAVPHVEEGRFWEGVHTYEQQKTVLQGKVQWDFLPDIGPLPDVRVLEYFPLSKDNGIKVRTQEGTVFYEKEPTQIYLPKIPENIQKAIIWTEDEEFYEHKGINWKGKASAVVSILKGKKRGGSSITEQVGKQLALKREEAAQRTGLEGILRKVADMATAVELEREYTKDEILTFYANYMHFGSGVYGVEAASRMYFGKSAEKLELNEAVFLACMLNDPNNDPRTQKGFKIQWKDYEKEIEKLERKEYITEKQATMFLNKKSIVTKERVKKKELASIYSNALHTVYHYGFLQNLGVNMREAIDPTERWYSIDITTTIAKNATEAAYTALANASTPRGSTSSMVVLDKEQRIITIVSENARQKLSTVGSMENPPLEHPREIASTIKPLYWVYGLEQGIFTMNDVFDESTRHNNNKGEPWPRNYDYRYDRTMTAHKALITSNNRITVQIYDQIVTRQLGIERLKTYLHHVGLGTEDYGEFPFPIYALGIEKATTVELAHVYNNAFNNAEQCDPWIIERVILGEHEFMYNCQPTKKRIETNIAVKEALEDVARIVHVHNPHGTVGFKTGTNNGPKMMRIAGFYEYEQKEYSFVIDVDGHGKNMGEGIFAGKTNGPIANAYFQHL